MMSPLSQRVDIDKQIPQVTQPIGTSTEQPNKRQKLSTPNSFERTHPIVALSSRPTLPSKEPILVENEEVLGADQGNVHQPPTLKVRRSSIAAAEVDEFGMNFLQCSALCAKWKTPSTKGWFCH